jgi:hypothetical protein
LASPGWVVVSFMSSRWESGDEGKG